MAHVPSLAPFPLQHFPQTAPFAESPSITAGISSARVPTGAVRRIAPATIRQGQAFGFARSGAAFDRPFISAPFRSGHFLRNPYAHWPAFAQAYFRGGSGRSAWQHHRSAGAIGWDGSLFWPYGYDDLLDYTLYPYAYDAFWPYAYDDVYDGIALSTSSTIGNAYAATGTPGKRRPAETIVGRVCGAEIGSLTPWQTGAMLDAMGLDESQRAALTTLEAGTARAVDVLKAACPRELPSTPTARIDAMHERLAAMLAAVRFVRVPLVEFYGSLAEPQKARFDALGSEQDTRPQIAPDLSRICSEKLPAAAGVPIERIERAVRPSGTQYPSLQHLADALIAARGVLRASCSGASASTPVVRLDAMERRLDAMLRAIEIVQPALHEFYDLLSSEQKDRFNLLAPPAG